MANIENFIAEIRKTNVARGTKYECTFTTNRSLNIGAGNVGRRLALFCEEAQLPGKIVQTRSARFNALSEQRVHTIDYMGESVVFQFLLDEDFTAKEYFESWMESMIDYNTREISFYKDIVGEVRIVNFRNSEKEKTMVTILEEAFPRSIQLIPLGYSNTGALRLNVSIAFRRWRSEYLKEAPQDAQNAPKINPDEITSGAQVTGPFIAPRAL